MDENSEILIDKGIKPTKMRIGILQFLMLQDTAIGLQNIRAAFLKSRFPKKSANRTTFYRVIKKFEEKGIVHRIDDGTGIIKFALSKKEGDTHMHLHCINCNITKCLENQISKESLPKGYEIADINMVIKGFCEKCQKKNN